jgi:hypothetical protein
MTTLTHTFIVTNTGNGSDTFTFAAVSSMGWPITLPANLTLAAPQSAPMTVTLTVPAGSGGLSHTLIFTATSIKSAAATTSTIATATIPLSRSVSFVANQSSTVQPGEAAAFNHTLTNTGNSTDTFTLTSSGTQPWLIDLQPAAPITLAAGQSTNVQATIQTAADATSGMINQVTITATSNLSPTSAVQSVVDLLTIQSNLPSQNYIYLPLVLNKPAPPADIDLVITDIIVEPATPDSGQPATVYVTVKNQGTAAVKAGNNFFIDFYVDPATQPGSLQQGVLFWSVQGIDVAAGQSKTFSAAYTFGPGTHQLYGQADTDSTVHEINESNNVFGPQSITVTGSALQEAPTAPLDETPADPRPTPTPVP